MDPVEPIILRLLDMGREHGIVGFVVLVAAVALGWCSSFGGAERRSVYVR